MSPEISPNDAKTLWRKQPSEETVVTLDNIRDRAEKFQSRVRRRNMRDYLAALVVVVVFGFYIWIFPGWVRRVAAAQAQRGASVTGKLRHAPCRLPPRRVDPTKRRAEVGGHLVFSAVYSGLRANCAGALFPVSRPRPDNGLGSPDHRPGGRRYGVDFRNRLAT